MRCGLLGRTLGHSFSPAIHAAIDANYSYELFECEPDVLDAFFSRRLAGHQRHYSLQRNRHALLH